MQNNEPMLAADYTCTLPSMYLIEPGNICNLKCPFCPTGAGIEGFAPGFMSLETYKTIFGKIRTYAKWIGLYNNGEPLLNKAIIPMIAMASEHGIYTNMSSHLSLPNIDHEALVRSGLCLLIVSMDGTSQATYAKYKVGGDIAVVMKNIERIQEAKARLNLQTPAISWSFLINRFNEHEMAEARTMAHELGVHIELQLMSVEEREWESSFHRRGIVPVCLKGSDPAQYAIAERSLPIKVADIILHPKAYNFCKQLFTMMLIHSNGEALPCCAIYEKGASLGNILTADIAELWNNSSYRACRQYIYNLGSQPATAALCATVNCPLHPRHLLHRVRQEATNEL